MIGMTRKHPTELEQREFIEGRESGKITVFRAGTCQRC